MALLHAFLQIKDEFALDVRAIHVNHGVRAQEADRDEAFVRQQCHQWNVPLVVRYLKGVRKKDEQTLRQQRYQQFEEVLKAFPEALVATGHTADDNIETVLMRWAKGSSLKGLAGIPVKRDPFIRPFLFLTRAEVEIYVKEQRIPYIEDSSNLDDYYLRNRIRHNIMPAFVQVFGEQVIKNMAHSIQKLNEIQQLLSQQAQNIITKMVQRDSNSFLINLTDFLAQPAYFRKQILTYCISSYYPLNYQLSEKRLAKIEKFILTAQPGARLVLKKDVLLFRERHQIRIARELDKAKTVLELNPAENIQLEGWELSITEVTRDQITFTNDRNIEFICGDNIKFPLKVRYWQEGDSFFPLGLGKSQKLKTFFVNEKVERFEKKNIPIVLNGEDIVWVAGLRIDHRYRVTDTCKKIYRLKLNKWRSS